MYLLYLSHLQDSELNELRKTIELLKKQNAAAQAAINGVINTPELNCKGNVSQALDRPLVQCQTQPSCEGQETVTQVAPPRGRSQKADPFHLLASGHCRDGQCSVASLSVLKTEEIGFLWRNIIVFCGFSHASKII